MKKMNAFAHSSRLLQSPSDIIVETMQSDVIKASPFLSASTLFWMMLSHTGGRLNLPPSRLRLGFKALVYMQTGKAKERMGEASVTS